MHSSNRQNGINKIFDDWLLAYQNQLLAFMGGTFNKHKRHHPFW